MTQGMGSYRKITPLNRFKHIIIKYMKSVLLNTTVIGQSVKLPRHPRLIIGEEDKYIHGDILDANAVKKEIDNAVSRVVVDNEVVTQQMQDIKDELQTEINNKFTQIVGTAPEALDTLKEIADALDNDPEFASKIVQLIDQINEVNEEQSVEIHEIRTESSWNDV